MNGYTHQHPENSTKKHNGVCSIVFFFKINRPLTKQTNQKLDFKIRTESGSNMPSKIDSVRINANKENAMLDRRRKLTDDDKNTIRRIYFTEPVGKRPSISFLARQYNVSRRLIQFILFPERKARQDTLAKERRKDGRYYDKEKGRTHMRDHRAYKRQLIRSGKLNGIL